MPFGGLLTVGIIGAVGSLAGGALSANAANNAADEQAQSQQQALGFQQQVWNQQQQNLAPFLENGQVSIGRLMGLLNGGIPSFAAPTLGEAEASPGFAFTQEQGNKGILEGAAATGGAISGGTLRALDQFNTGLANSTYNDVYSRALSTYQTNLARQAQQFQQLFQPVALGEAAGAGRNYTGSQTAYNVGNLMSGIGNARAAGTVGSANAISSGISGAANSLVNSLLLKNLMNNPGPLQDVVGNTSTVDPFAGYLAQSGVGPG